MLLTYQIMLKLKTISINKIALIEYQLYNFSKLKLTKQYYLKIEGNQIKVIKINNYQQNSKYAADHQVYFSCKTKINSNESITRYITKELNKEKIYSNQEFDYDDTYNDILIELISSQEKIDNWYSHKILPILNKYSEIFKMKG